MLMIENMAALCAFAICLLAFLAGYRLRNHVDETRAEWARYSAYRRGSARGRAAGMRARNNF